MYPKFPAIFYLSDYRTMWFYMYPIYPIDSVTPTKVLYVSHVPRIIIYLVFLNG